MKIKTVTTTVGVNAIHFDGYTPKYYWIKNLSDTTLYVSANPNPVAGADNVSELSAKASTAIETDEGTIYILGTGKVEIHNTDSKLCPFELASTGSGGGGGGSVTVDSYLSDTSTNPVQNKVITETLGTKANTADIPTSLPANGGNANTVNNHTVNSDVPADAVFTDTVYNIGDGLLLDKDKVLSVDFDVVAKNEVFGFQLDTTEESDPASCITYIEGNKNYTPAKVDLTTGVMDYGDWGDAWFIQGSKPVMLKFNGTVAYELNKDDYSKKIDGTDSDVANEAFEGNAMMGFPTVWIKVDTTNAVKPRFYFANRQVDANYHAYAHTDTNGNIIPYAYMPIYNGWVDSSGRMRSLSGKNPTRSQDGNTQIAEARANNPEGQNIWDLEVTCDRQLVTLLLMLIGKSTDTQTVFGNGNVDGYNTKPAGTDEYGVYPTGTMNDKGLFYGTNATNLGVKVFGIEHYWGNLWRRIYGSINDNGVIKIKMTKGAYDGSTVSDYNTTGEGYITIGNAPSNPGYINAMHINQYGLFPSDNTGSATTYYCDCVWVNNAQVDFALAGARSFSGSGAGAFTCDWDDSVTTSDWGVTASASCKPLV